MGKRSLFIGACACVVIAAPAAARAHGIRYRAATPPTHFTIGNQVVDGSVAGLRAYLDTTKQTDAQLYAQLAPDLERLETRVATARVVLAVGATVGVASFAYAIAVRNNCRSPSVDDPNFGAKVDSWAACNEGHMQTRGTAALIGLGAMIVGGVGWMAISPGRADLLSFVNRHNAMSREPLRFQLGYDPARRFAHAGATLSF